MCIGGGCACASVAGCAPLQLGDELGARDEGRARVGGLLQDRARLLERVDGRRVRVAVVAGAVRHVRVRMRLGRAVVVVLDGHHELRAADEGRAWDRVGRGHP